MGDTGAEVFLMDGCSDHAPSYLDEELDLSHASVPPRGNSPLAGDGRIATH
jgi:hypothetical protein